MEIQTLIEDAVSKIQSAETPEVLESVRVEFLGRNGRLTKILKSIGSLSPDERIRVGKEANEARRRLEEALTEKKDKVGQKRGGSYFDTSLPGMVPMRGGRHPIHRIISDVAAIFRSFGFEIVRGREIETEFYNFTALNIPLDHPSRDAFDTFYTKSGNLLRSQTSTVQIRVMQDRKPPLRILAPGRVYRPDTVDASHSFMFHQIEGLAVDERITFGDLKGMLNLFLRKLFGEGTVSRLRPHFFPFTEPSVEVDVRCIICKGKGCPTCGRSGWLEVMGAGMVNPAVFRHVGYPAGRFQGFAFGMGVERMAMLRYGIRDIRLFFENDLHFLRQFA